VVVTVILHTILQKKLPPGAVDQLELVLPEGVRVGDLLRELEITIDPGAILLVINHRIVERSAILADGDRLDIIPAISGG